MRPDDELQPGLKEALRALAAADRGLEAGPEVEVRLRKAFRRKQRRTVWPAAWAIAATAILGIGIGYYRSLLVTPGPIAGNTPAANSTVPAVKPNVPETATRPEGQVAVNQTGAKPRIAPVRYTPRNSQPREIATDFFPLVDFAPQLDTGELMRVSLPASAMRQVGLPVREDRMAEQVQADVLVSNGLATAIRFVSYAQ